MIPTIVDNRSARVEAIIDEVGSKRLLWRAHQVLFVDRAWDARTQDR